MVGPRDYSPEKRKSTFAMKFKSAFTPLTTKIIYTLSNYLRFKWCNGGIYDISITLNPLIFLSGKPPGFKCLHFEYEFYL